jgi:hypothetical protein
MHQTISMTERGRTPEPLRLFMQRSQSFRAFFSPIAYGESNGWNGILVSDPVHCASRDLEVVRRPWREARAYCPNSWALWSGLVLYSEVTMKTQAATSGITGSGRWIPITPEAFRRLEAEADRLVAALGDSQSTAGGSRLGAP